MAHPPRRPTSAFDKAEAIFKPAATKPATTKPSATASERPAVPPARESVTLRIDRQVLQHFQEDGPGWQDRINAALRAAAGLS